MKNITYSCISILLTIGISACSNKKVTGENKIASNDQSGDIVCVRTKKVGSHMKVKHCMTKAEKERLRKESQDRLRADQDSEALRALDGRVGSGP